MSNYEKDNYRSRATAAGVNTAIFRKMCKLKQNRKMRKRKKRNKKRKTPAQLIRHLNFTFMKTILKEGENCQQFKLSFSLFIVQHTIVVIATFLCSTFML